MFGFYTSLIDLTCLKPLMVLFIIYIDWLFNFSKFAFAIFHFWLFGVQIIFVIHLGNFTSHNRQYNCYLHMYEAICFFFFFN